LVSAASSAFLISAEQAAQWGIIWQLVDDAELADTSLQLARHLAAQAPGEALIIALQIQLRVETVGFRRQQRLFNQPKTLG
jgi:2-(1,2-epoxy-1,2-dihydrophenyl)acetyl-CoA isomerase